MKNRRIIGKRAPRGIRRKKLRVRTRRVREARRRMIADKKAGREKCREGGKTEGRLSAFLRRMRERARGLLENLVERARGAARRAGELIKTSASRVRAFSARTLHSARDLALRCLRFIRDGEQYYIGGGDVLPPPLTPAEEADILSRLNDERELTQVLIERNLRLVVYIAKKFENTGTDIEDIISIGTIGLIKAVNTFNPDRGIKLATYASRCIENEILMHIRKNSGKRADVSIDEPLNVDWDGNELLLSDVLSGDEDEVYGAIEHDEDYRILHRAVESLPEREQIIITLRFGLGGGPERTQAEVAKMLGISQSYISRLEKKILGDLRRTIGSGT